jgi:glucosamine--fructose-6-phosphate aminotransferase (isomerizing)
MALFLGRKTNLSPAIYNQIIDNIKILPDLQRQILADQYIKEVAKEIPKFKHFFFLGRFLQYPIALESSLKFKEITYLFSSGYPS